MADVYDKGGQQKQECDNPDKRCHPPVPDIIGAGKRKKIFYNERYIQKHQAGGQLNNRILDGQAFLANTAPPQLNHITGKRNQFIPGQNFVAMRAVGAAGKMFLVIKSAIGAVAQSNNIKKAAKGKPQTK